ncbi:MAG: P-type conjugative transfer ATPase TrbB [Planctomycetota bacterium]
MNDSIHPPASRHQVRTRHLDSLSHALGPTIAAALADDEVVEVMANPDGGLWVDRAGTGRKRLGDLDPHAAETVIRLLANHMGEPCGRDRLSVAGTLPDSGERFQGVLPPIVERPSFTIRKRPKVIYTLDDYLADETMTAAQAEAIRQAIAERRNIMVAGGTGSGKTTLANAILAEPVFRHDRVVILEDTRELQCAAEDRIELLTKQADPAVTMRDLLKMTLRFRPDRIVVGEVRGGEALDMLKAWNTGHPGGIATVHANSAEDAVGRVADLVAEVSGVDAERLIRATIGVTLFLERCRETHRRRLSIAYPDRS